MRILAFCLAKLKEPLFSMKISIAEKRAFSGQHPIKAFGEIKGHVDLQSNASRIFYLQISIYA
jgi:hypothetical protein